jgi:hypothetical protein
MINSNNNSGWHKARRSALTALALTGATLLIGLAAGAQDEAPNPKDGEVAVGGKTILTIRVPSEGMTVKERAEAVTNRLVTILNDSSLRPSDIIAVPLGRNAAKIMVKNQLLVTIDPQTARINQAKPLALANIWVDHLRRVLPHVSVKPNPNLGEPPGNNEANKNIPPQTK